MIGIVGPPDSVALATSVAGESGLADEIVTRAYATIGEAVHLAREIDHLCHVILFTGRVPFALTAQQGGVRALLDFVPHTGVDLYPALLGLMRTNRGELPEFSLDTIERSAVAEVFEDLSLPPPEHLLSLDEADDQLGVGDPSRIVGFHEKWYHLGSVSACLTCLDSVHSALLESGIPAYRIVHTRPALRVALHRARLLSRLAQSEATQVAVVRIEATKGVESHDGELVRRLQESLAAYAERLRGRMTEVGPEAYVIHTTRGAVEDAIRRLAAGYASGFDLRNIPVPVVAAAGVGSTAASAEEQARRALQVSRSTGQPHVFFEDGTLVHPDGQGLTRTIAPNGDRVASLASKLGMGALAFARLTEALQRVDPSAVTANQLAAARGIKPRSARRLLVDLEKVGLATRLGHQSGLTAGRPQIAWRVDMAKLA